MYFQGGRLFENEKNSGITFLLLNMMSKHIENEEQGFLRKLSIENHADFLGFNLNSTSSNFQDTLKFLHLLISEKINNEDSLEEAKQISRMEIQRVMLDPLRRPVELFYQSLFTNHPYGLSRYGTYESLDRITLEEVVDWQNELIHMDNSLITIVGNVSGNQVIDEIFEIFGMIPAKTKSRRAQILPLIPFKKFEPKIEDVDEDWTGIVLGHKGVDIKDERYYELEVLRNWLAGSRGQLHLSLREKLSLAKTVNAYNVSLLRGGIFFLHAITMPLHEDTLVAYMAAFFSSLGKLVIPKDVFEPAKQQAIALFSQGLRSHDAVAYYIASQHMAGIHIEHIDQYKDKIQDVTRTQLQTTLSEIFSENSYATGMVRGQRG